MNLNFGNSVEYKEPEFDVGDKVKYTDENGSCTAIVVEVYLIGYELRPRGSMDTFYSEPENVIGMKV